MGMGMSEHRAETLSQEPHRLASETAERIDVHREAGTYVEIAEIACGTDLSEDDMRD